jgi:DNA-binding beta-propeller fold protein YncE
MDLTRRLTLLRGPSFLALRIVILIGWLAWSSPTPAPAASAPLIGADFLEGRLYDVNPATGAATNPRDTGIPLLSGIARSPGGTLYGMSNAQSPVPNSIYTINPATGAATLLGATGLSGIFEGDLAFRPTNGVLYGVADASGTDRRLFTLNTTTGAATVVGAVLPGVTTDLSGLGFAADGRLLALDTGGQRLLTLDPATAAVLNNVPLGLELGPIAALSRDPSSGALYVADGGGPGTAGTNNLYLLNADTGALTLVGPTGLEGGLASLAFVPEPGTAAAGIATLLAAGLTRRR